MDLRPNLRSLSVIRANAVEFLKGDGAHGFNYPQFLKHEKYCGCGDPSKKQEFVDLLFVMKVQCGFPICPNPR